MGYTMNYCPECGKQIQADHTFCPYCGNEKLAGYRFCPLCGNNLSDGTFYCSKCTSQNTPAQTKETKEQINKQWTRIRLPVSLKKISRRTAVMGLLLICLVAIIGAAVFVVQPLDLFGTIGKQATKGRDISISIENTNTLDATCELKIGDLKHGESFLVISSEILEYPVNENDLYMQQPTYAVTLYVTIKDLTLEAKAEGVTTSASFRISPSDDDDFTVECLSFT